MIRTSDSFIQHLELQRFNLFVMEYIINHFRGLPSAESKVFSREGKAILLLDCHTEAPDRTTGTNGDQIHLIHPAGSSGKIVYFLKVFEFR